MNEQNLSAYERMLAFREHQAFEDAGVTDYFDTLPFSPDPFQEEALHHVAAGQATLVCAPTGSGKTVVGEGAAYLAHRRGERVFYTTPIKALSNQKFKDFQEKFGESEVGLLTGDTSINSRAPIVVMTTEVLRNMIYQGSDLADLGVVVLDEVHYLSDRFRGPVWEEVIIQAPTHVQIVALSATISNSKEFGDWVASVRGDCKVVTDNKRPVPLYQEMVVGGYLYPLYANPSRAARAKNPASQPLNRDLLEAVEEASRAGHGRRYDRGRTFSRPRPYSRRHLLSLLLGKQMLPAIVFIFSRAGCDEAAERAAGFGLNFVSREEKWAIRQATDAALAEIPIADHGALNLPAWAATLQAGVAPHHAGLLPQQKEVTEQLFSAGLLKVVFATETLALGINMPARTVVLESLEKWDGSEHVRLSPRDFTQLTGRAGRRGIDVEGHAVVPARGHTTPEELSELASGRQYPLHSAFQPNYNMAVNLLGRASLEQAKEVLESSFAQYQADASVVHLSRDLYRTDEELGAVSKELNCSRGDAGEYFALRGEAARLQKRASRVAREARLERSVDLLGTLKTGDVIDFRRGRRRRQAVVVQAPNKQFGDRFAKVIVDDAKQATVGMREATSGIDLLGRIPLKGRSGRRPKDRTSLAADVRSMRGSRGRSRSGGSALQAEADSLREQGRQVERELRDHPVHSCPRREVHASLGHKYARLLRDRDRIAKAINTDTNRIVAEFDQVCQVLDNMGFLHQEREDGAKTYRVTKRGERLRRIFGERDLLVSYALATRAWERLGPEELAAIVSSVVYEPRGDDVGMAAPREFVTFPLTEAWHETEALYQQINRQEVRAGREATAEPSPALVDIIYRWARGASLAKIMERTELSGGDFVRWVRQIIDMLDQIRRSTDPSDPVAKAAAKARNLLTHGVVAWTEFG